MEKHRGTDYYLLTNPQKRILYTESIYDNHSMWNIGGALKINDNVKFDILELAINITIKKNQGIRLRFINDKDETKQYVEEYTKVNIDRFYFNTCEEFYDFSNKDFKKGMNIYRDDLYYFALCNVNNKKSFIYLKMHHIISDGWSLYILSKQICKIYDKLVNIEEIQDNNEFSYIDFIESEKNYIQSDRFIKDKYYWNKKFECLPECILESKGIGIDSIRETIILSKKVSDKIKEFSKNNKYSLNTFFTAVYLIYINKIYGKNDITIGIPVLNRSNKRQRNMVGMFTSTMPFRYIINEEDSIDNLIKGINSDLVKNFLHQKYPYNILTEDLELNKKKYDNLFQICINYYNTEFDIELSGKPVEIIEFYNGSQTYSLQVIVKEWLRNGQISLGFDYKVGDYTEKKIQNMIKDLECIINQVIKNYKEKIYNINIMPKEEIEKLKKIHSINADYPKEKTVYELFEERTMQKPNNIALSFENTLLTYKQLNEKTNQLARKLKTRAIGFESKVGILANHSLEMVIGLLAVIKAGAAYVPIDPAYPAERINYIIKDSNISIILTNREFTKGIEFNGEYINLNDKELYTGETSNLNVKCQSHNLVYIIYTSGSTGKPKGVMVEHGGLTNYICWAKKMYIKSEKDIFALYSSLSFDLTVTSIFTPLINGNRINIYYDDGSEFILYKILKENQVNIIKLTPAHLFLLKDRDNRNSSVKRFIVGGEDLKTTLAANVYESFDENIEIYNEYGPTETVVGCMLYKYNYKLDKHGSVPIGIAADNVQIYILDKHFNVVPYDVTGELFISGDGVSRGYLNNSELTEKSFIPNPFIEGKMMYKTGDEAKYRNDGIIEYIGRTDKQVKIRGHRIELGEIENQLLAIEGIKEAVVAINEEEGTNKLCAYVVTDKELTNKVIRNKLMEFLPDYMIPGYIEILDKLPLTYNGKVNTKLLPVPKKIEQGNNEVYVPQNEMQEKLIISMKKVLNVDKLGLMDNFYELGGDSIKAIQISNKLNNLGLNIKVKDILSHASIEEIAACIQFDKKNKLIEQTICNGEIESIPMIDWFFRQNFKQVNYWNQSVFLEIDNKITTEMLEISMNEIIKHHDGLRMNYDHKGKMFYYNNKHLDIDQKIKLYDLSSLSYEEQKNEIVKIGEKFKASFDIENDILFKACVFYLGENGRRLLITAHHLVIDGVSWRIILEDLCNLLEQQIKNSKVQLPLKTTSLQTWGKELKEYSINLKRSKYEMNQEKSHLDCFNDYDFGEDTLEVCSSMNEELDEEETKLLLTKANEIYGTESNEILIMSLALAISELTHNSEVTIELEGHGREEISENLDMSRTVGWFTSMYPITLNITEKELSKEIKLLKEQLRNIHGNGFDYWILNNNLKSYNNTNSKMIRFNYLGDFDSNLANNLFKLANEKTGSNYGQFNNFTCLIEVVAMVINKKLYISITYSRNKFKEETIKYFTEKFLYKLREVLNHCCAQKEKYFTPSDFDAVEVSQEDLDNLFS